MRAIFVRIVTKGNKVDLVPILDVSAPVETGRFLATAGDDGRINESGESNNNCRRNDELILLSRLNGTSSL